MRLFIYSSVALFEDVENINRQIKKLLGTRNVESKVLYVWYDAFYLHLLHFSNFCAERK